MQGNKIKIVFEPPPQQSSADKLRLSARRFLGRQPGRRGLLPIAGIALIILALGYLVNLYRPQSIAFSYSGQNCTTLPVLLPGNLRQQPSRSFRIEPMPTISIGKTVVYAQVSCLRATTVPAANSTEKIGLSLPGVPALHKTMRIAHGSYPAISRQTKPGKLISTKDRLEFTISQADHLFTYQIYTGNNRADCLRRDLVLSCDVPGLRLTQAARYELTVERRFSGKPAGTAFRQSVQTVEPIQIISSSITAGQTIYDIPADIVLTLNKPVDQVKNIVLKTTAGEPAQTVPVTPSIKDTVLTLKLGKSLPRNVPMQLSIGDITSSDGGYLSGPYSLAFTSSGGPKVQRVSIGSYKVQPGQAIVLTFDSNIGAAPNHGQNLQDFIKVESAAKVNATITAAGNQVTIRPASLGACAAFSVKVLDGLKNEFGVTGGSVWQYNSRIICQQPFSIGTSVQGRAITAYRFGSGDNKIVYVGGTHGNEKSSVTILNRWIEQLEANAHRIPARSSLIVIPALSPDGYAANKRTNANNVDLNRNFPADNWKSGVTLPDKTFLPVGGGGAPLSEPESRAIANYLTAQNPRLVLTYHASGNVVIPNDSGDSVALARQYANKSSVYFAANSQTATIFEYDTTGAMEDWLHDKPGITTLLIELYSHASNDYPDHETALWWTAGL